MILCRWLVAAFFVLASPLQAEQAAHVFFFGNSLVLDEAGGDEASVPHWLARMAAAGGQSFAADGTTGTVEDFARALPPASDWRIGGVARLMSDNPRSFRMAGFDTLVLAPPNDRQENADDTTAELIRRTFDWAGRQGLRRFFLYEGWAAMASPGPFPPDGQALEDWQTRSAGSYDSWYRDLVSQLRDALPEARIGLVPVARVMAELSGEGALAGIEAGDLFLDAAPRGTPSAYLLAAMVTWSALHDGPAPVIDLPDSIIPALRDDYPAIAEAIWLHLAGAVAPEDATLQPPETGFADPSLAFGLNAISDWSSQMPFLDVMKTARPWIGHLPGQWGGVGPEDLRAGGFLSPEGWPVAVPEGVEALETLILTDLSADADDAAGRYVVTWAGEGTLELTGRAYNTETGDHEIRFSFTPGPGLVGIRISALDPEDPIRDISVIREDRLDLARAGVVFNPDFIAVVQDARMVRFMDWMATNNSAQVTWADRPRPGDATWAAQGVPVEVMVDLANRIGADPWFTLPHMADDDYVGQFAQYVHDHLDPRLKAHAEWSNEVWNFIFQQAHWATEQARTRWGDGADGDAWMQLAGTRAAEVADIWAGVFADDPGRLVRVVGVHTGWRGLEEPLLEAPRRQAEGLPPPAASFDAYAVSGYFGGEIGAEDFAPTLRGWIAGGTATQQVTRALREGSLREVTSELWPYHARVASGLGLTLLMYEGGSHLAGHGAVTEDEEITRFFTSYSYSPEMAGLYAEVLGAWRDLGRDVPTGPFNAFVDIAPPSRWGSWGARRHTGDVNPRWATLAAWNSLPFGGDRDNDTFLHGVLRRADAGGAGGGAAGGMIEGTSRADILIGGADDVVIISGGGDDLIAGGAGHSTVILPGRAEDWTPAHDGTALWMIGAAGEVRMVDVEEIGFADDPDAILRVDVP